MSKVYLSATVDSDGALTIPAFAVRGLGYEPGDEVNLTLPVTQAICDCDDNELFLSRCCAEAECGGYTNDGDELNIPARLLCDAMIPAGSEISVLSADGALLIIAAEEPLDELPLELTCFLAELGITTHSLRQGLGSFRVHCRRECDE